MVKLMKCSVMLHFILVFTVCKSTRLVASRIQRVKVKSLSSVEATVSSSYVGLSRHQVAVLLFVNTFQQVFSRVMAFAVSSDDKMSCSMKQH